MGFQTSIAVFCRQSGVILQVLHDDLGLTSCFSPGTSLRALVERESSSEAERLFREIRENGVALNVKLEIRCHSARISLLISGYTTDQGIHLIGATQPLSRKFLMHELARQPDPEKDATLIRDAVLALTAHDLRNHLNGILAASQYLLHDAVNLLDSEQLELLRSIVSSGRDMFRVLDNVMQVATFESANRGLNLKPTDVVAAIGKSVSAHRSRAERKKVRLEFTPGAVVPLIAADPAGIDRVIESLVASSIDLAASGSKIEISFGAESRRTLVSVRVESSNISSKQLQSILGATHPDLEGVKAGTVLALRVMSRTVEEHGGRIAVAGATGDELTITLVLPISGEAPMIVQGA